MSLRTVFKSPVAEGATAQYTGQLVDEAGANIPKSALVSLTLTLFNAADSEIINQVENVDILDKSRGTVGSTGLITIVLLPADNVISDETEQLETHIMFLQWTYGDQGSKAGNHEVEFQVYNREKLPVVVPQP